MTKADFSLEVSIAQPSNFKAIRRLCRRAAGPDDYVIRILCEIINDRGLFLAWVGDQLVGITNFDVCIYGSGWLSMARTDPDWQGRGVARFLQRELGERAKKDNIRLLRLWTLSTNWAAIRACEKGGFRTICEAAHVSHGFRSRNSSQYPQFSSASSTGRILKSSYLSKTQGYFAYKWHFIKANKALIGEIQQRRELCFHDGLTFILTKPEISFHRLTSVFSLLEGDPARLMRLISSKARSRGVDWVGGYLPYDHHLLEVASKTGFKLDGWGNHCLVFEKAV